jgi:hypothetical protein
VLEEACRSVHDLVCHGSQPDRCGLRGRPEGDASDTLTAMAGAADIRGGTGAGRLGARHSRRLNRAEINSSFHGPHQASFGSASVCSNSIASMKRAVFFGGIVASLSDSASTLDGAAEAYRRHWREARNGARNHGTQIPQP